MEIPHINIWVYFELPIVEISPAHMGEKVHFYPGTISLKGVL